MRQAALISLSLAVLVLGLAACGGGSNSTTPTGGSSTTAEAPAAGGPEADWATEVTEVMSDFENEVSAEATEAINTTGQQGHLEPLYLVYGGNLARLARKLEATKAPAACVALRKQIAGYAKKIGALTIVMGQQGDLSEDQYGHFIADQKVKISAYGRKLSAAVAEPTC